MKTKKAYKYELDGTFIEQQEPATDPVSNYLAKVKRKDLAAHMFGYLWSYEKKDKIDTENFRAIRLTFPDYDPAKHANIYWNDIRPYIDNGNRRPVTRYGIDGTFMKIYFDVFELQNDLDPNYGDWTHRIEPIEKHKQPRWYGYVSYSTLDEIHGLHYNERNEQLFQKSLKYVLSHVNGPRSASNLDWDFIRNMMESNIKRKATITKPIWQYEKSTNKKIKRWVCASEAEEFYNLGIGSISQVINHHRKGKRSDNIFHGFRWEIADFDKHSDV